MLSHCNVPSCGAARDFPYFPSPRLVWLAERRELQQRLFSMDRILHERGAQLVVGAAVEEIFLRRIFSGTERGKLELGFLNGPNIKKTLKKPFKNH